MTCSGIPFQLLRTLEAPEIAQAKKTAHSKSKGGAPQTPTLPRLLDVANRLSEASLPDREGYDRQQYLCDLQRQEGAKLLDS